MITNEFGGLLVRFFIVVDNNVTGCPKVSKLQKWGDPYFADLLPNNVRCDDFIDIPISGNKND